MHPWKYSRLCWIQFWQVIHKCKREWFKWFWANRLSLNPTKPIFLIIQIQIIRNSNIYNNSNSSKQKLHINGTPLTQIGSWMDGWMDGWMDQFPILHVRYILCRHAINIVWLSRKMRDRNSRNSLPLGLGNFLMQ